jgi:hypothetical protein
MSISLERKQRKSLYYWLVDVLSEYPTVNVTDAYPYEELELPTVSVDGGEIEAYPYQLGGSDRQRERHWTIDIFGTSQDQVDQLASEILDAIDDNSMEVYDYDEGFESPTRIGTLIPGTYIRVYPDRVFPDLVEKLYWRNSISFVTYYEAL